MPPIKSILFLFFRYFEQNKIINVYSTDIILFIYTLNPKVYDWLAIVKSGSIVIKQS